MCIEDVYRKGHKNDSVSKTTIAHLPITAISKQ